ncbi:hypothetical protein FJTKL_02852 [Diaporthe vaccinii]
MAARQQDDLAVAQNGGMETEDADLDGDDGDLDDDDMMDKISSSPSIDDEDIDFELVYALHTFIATVEGQANATKGDAMVLLDDSNSYWWLVRVVKDSSIGMMSPGVGFYSLGLNMADAPHQGYLPAEHIETPTERLARLNKHRNIDLSATMLGDQSDKTKNPIKTAMRRRKKNVSFAAPTYVDYSDFDYDTEEEEEAEAEFYAQQQQQQQQAQQQSQQQSAATKQTTADETAASEEAAQVAPLRPRAQKTVQIVDPANSDSKEESPTSAKGNRTSEEIFETNGVEGPKRKADGTVRDSFFKDDTVETKKITLTPNLLRDDGTVRASTDSDKGVNKRPSFDKLDKEIREEKKGKDKKEKEKKGGFRSLFSRKDKKQKGGDDDDSLGKRSMDAVAEAPERESEDFNDDQDKAGASPQRNPSKLHKQQPRVEPSLANKSGTVQRDANGMDLSTFLNEGKLKNVANVPPASMRLVEPDAQDQRGAEAVRSNQVDETKASRSAASRSDSVDDSPPQATTAKSRMQIEDSDSGEDDYNETLRQMSGSGKKTQEKPQQESPQQDRTQQEKPQQEGTQKEEPQQEKPFRPTLPGAFPDSYMSTQSAQSNSTITPERAAEATQRQDRLSESPIEVSPITPSGDKPPALVGDTSSQEDHSSPVSSPSPELIDREEAGGTHRNQDSITTSTSTTTVSNWNDTSLREFFDSGTDIRDLLVVVYDKTDVEPVGPEHPVAGTLFKEQNAKLAEITTQLDHMLGDWLARKQRLRGTV